jgi:dTDP-4-amino-4,6-dideoxygalactose transaminase
MDEICDIAKKNGLVVVEDSAQSIGSTYKGVQSGAYGLAGCFSTHPLKNLNACGDGGFVTTNNLKLANDIKLMRSHGLVDRNRVENFGFVSRMDALQAAILTFRLGKLDDVILKRRINAESYISNLNIDEVVFPPETNDYFNTYHTFVVRVKDRDKLASWLLSKGVQTAIHYPIPIHLQPAAQKYGHRLGDFPAVECQAAEILSLPIHQYLKQDQIEYVIEAIINFYRQN